MENKPTPFTWTLSLSQFYFIFYQMDIYLDYSNEGTYDSPISYVSDNNQV